MRICSYYFVFFNIVNINKQIKICSIIKYLNFIKTYHKKGEVLISIVFLLYVMIFNEKLKISTILLF